MEQRQVISLDSVDRIRVYVKHKYKDLPDEKHADIIADAIVKIIDRQLPPFPSQMRQKVCQSLISNVIAGKKRPVQYQDIIEACEVMIESDAQCISILEQWKQEQGIVSINGVTSAVVTPISKSEPATLAQSNEQNSDQSKLNGAIKRKVIYAIGCIVIIGATFTWQYMSKQMTANDVEHAHEMVATNGTVTLPSLPHNELPKHYQFHEVDKSKLKEYLDTRSSILREDRYFDAIYNTAIDFNISPILLFAITGQEQGFVHRDHPEAEVIANNPFNVFHSWEDFNTSIEDSTAIASRTIVNLSKERPADVEAVKWINRKYAEDPNWHKGVTSLFQTITNYIND